MMGASFDSPSETHGTMPVGISSVLDRQEVSRNRDQLRLLFEVSEAVASHRDLTALFRDLARRLPAIVPFDVIALFLHDPEKNVMRVHMIGHGRRRPDSAGAGGAGDGIVQWTGVHDAGTGRHPQSGRREALSAVAIAPAQIGVESFCVLPLTTIVRPLGAIGFGSLSPYAFGESELEFLGLVARQVAVAVDNVLHDESNQTAAARARSGARPAAAAARRLRVHRVLSRPR